MRRSSRAREAGVEPHPHRRHDGRRLPDGARPRRSPRGRLRDPRAPPARGRRRRRRRRRRLDGAAGSPARGRRRRDRARLLPRLRAARRPAAALSAPARRRRRARGSRSSSTLARPTRTRSPSSTASQARSCSTASRPPICSRRRSTAATTSRSRGTSTYPKAADLRTAAARIPADRILAETDAPYLAPQPVRGRPNEPANVVHTLAALAEARGQEAAALESAIEENAAAAFGLP